MVDGYYLTPETAADVEDLLRRSRPALDGKITPVPPGERNFHVQIATWSSGAGTGTLYRFNATSSAWQQISSQTVKVRSLDGSALTVGEKYAALRYGLDSSNTPVYIATNNGGGDECELLEVTLPAFATAASVQSAINSALGSLSFTGTVSITCSPNGTATASVTLTRSGGSPVSITGVPVTLEGCSLAIV